MPAIEAEGLVKTYGGRAAVDGVSFSVEPGEVFCVLGPNGAGKTTTIEILEGYRRADSGTARVLGLAPGDGTLKPRIGVMLQEGGVYPGSNAREMLRTFAAFYPDPEPPGALLERVGLASVARTPVRRLSGGEKQRLSLALALVGRPEVLFLDEPTAGMDPAARANAVEMLAGIAAGGATVLLTTHLLDEAERLAGRVAVIDRGRIVALGTPSELTRGDPREIAFVTEPGLDTAALASAAGAEAVVESAPGRYVARTSATPESVARLTAALAARRALVRELRVGRRSLEDVYLDLTRGAP